MLSVHRAIPGRPALKLQRKRIILLFSFLVGVFFFEGWLAGNSSLQAANNLSRDRKVVDSIAPHVASTEDFSNATGIAASHVGRTTSVMSAVAAETARDAVAHSFPAVNVPALPTNAGTTPALLPAPSASALLSVMGAPSQIRRAPPNGALSSDKTTPRTPEHRRDPFRPLVRNKDESAVPFVGPPGKPGLTVNTLQVQGTMRDADGMTAIVANPQGRVYFLRPGDEIYDALVQSIGPGGVVFQQHTQDAFGHSVEHIVTRLLGAAPGGTP